MWPIRAFGVSTRLHCAWASRFAGRNNQLERATWRQGTWNWRNLRLSEPVPIGSAGSRHLTCWLIQNNAPCLRGLIPASSCQRRAFLLGSRPHLAAVAQLVRAPDCGSGGRWFESTQLYQSNQTLNRKTFDALNFDVRAMSASPMPAGPCADA